MVFAESFRPNPQVARNVFDFFHLWSSVVPHQILWTSIQIFLHALWTKVEESRTRRQANQNPVDDLCSNCGLAPEHTQYMMVDCVMAAALWNEIQEIFNKIARDDDQVEEKTSQAEQGHTQV